MGNAGCNQNMTSTLAINKNKSLPRLRIANNNVKKTIIKI
jgi:hypothetical protein